MSEEANDEKSDALTELFGNVIYAYTREQAIEDGVLVDVSETAREAGFRWPFALTASVWSIIENIPAKHAHEDIAGRLWDVLMVAKAALRRSKANEDTLLFDVILHHAEGNKARLKLHCGPGDQGEAVLTLMLPNED